MKTININPINRRKPTTPSGEVELIKFNMLEDLRIESTDKDSVYFKINLNFKSRCMSKIFCLN